MRLGMVHKGTDVFRLLEQPTHVIAEMVRLTNALLDEMKADDE
jgi:hypothetical protein